MDEERIILITEVCRHYSLDPDFIRVLREYGLLEVIRRNEEEFLQEEQLSDLETLMHLHYDLEINMEGIDAISHLLRRVKEMQRELTLLRNRLG